MGPVPTPPDDNKVVVYLSPGRWVVEVRDEHSWRARRVQGDDGTPASAEALPDVTAMFARQRHTAAEFRDALDRRAHNIDLDGSDQ